VQSLGRALANRAHQLVLVLYSGNIRTHLRNWRRIFTSGRQEVQILVAAENHAITARSANQ
jgi:hypothetical protein